jgi:hypothetical protein
MRACIKKEEDERNLPQKKKKKIIYEKDYCTNIIIFLSGTNMKELSSGFFFYDSFIAIDNIIVRK